jgi:hypothetical protein
MPPPRRPSPHPTKTGTCAGPSRRAPSVPTRWRGTGDGGRRYVILGPLICSKRQGPAREDAYAPVEFGTWELLGDGRHVHCLAGAHGRPGVEDHEAHLRTRREVARVSRLRGRNPEELSIPRGRVVHGRHPWPAGLVGGPKRHVQVGVDDGSGNGPKILLGIHILLLSIEPEWRCRNPGLRDRTRPAGPVAVLVTRPFSRSPRSHRPQGSARRPRGCSHRR